MIKDLIKEYCEAEFENIEATLAEIALIVKPDKSVYSTGELAAVATFVHNFYNGMENILKRILISKDKRLKEGSDWHKKLLTTSVEAEIITSELCATLAEYLSFRHFFIHGYGFALKWEALQPLVANIGRTLQDFKSAVYRHLI